jgi:glutamine synthetase
VYIGWAQTNRSALIRIPRHKDGACSAARAELRCPDPSCNPYLAYKVMLAAALDGVDHGLVPPQPFNMNIYEMTPEDRRASGVEEQPGSLREALIELSNDDLMKKTLGPTLYEAFVRAKSAEWEEYRLRVMDWEVQRYLEIA